MKTVKYQKDQLDQSTHTYYYDKLNRLEEVFVSTDKVHQSRQAHYLYYDYGPLARVETGEQKVQGMDYAYTINGWMKAMNGTILDPGYELGRDNASGYLSQNTSVHNKVARDVVGYTLGYFDEDYQSIGSTNFTPSPFGFTAFDAAVSPMYNGNIAFTTTAIADVPGAVTPMEIQMGLYRYDQMNRLVAARTFRASGLAASNSWSGIAETQEYKSTYSYDQNGNLTHLLRNGGASNINMDDFSYNFEPVANTLPLTGTHASNRLDYVHDIGSYTGNYSQDIDDQSADNYGYDRLGQLIRDDSEGMTIEWFSGSRKVKNITSTTSVIDFEYNPFGQRILKKVKDLATGAITNSYYAYDANGQVMGVYTLDFETTGATLNELNLYGASRIGIIDKDVALCIGGTAQAVPVYPSPNPVTHILGYKKYEITNYLGNVNAVINDRKIYTGGTYTAVMLMNSDYYPFGMQMPGRHTNEDKYRFGYNDMEMDNEAKGNGNSYTTEFRQYDPRLGRWLSLDPLMAQFPWMSPYVAFDNNPIYYTDPLGLEATGDYYDRKTGKYLGNDGIDDGKKFTINGAKWTKLNADLGGIKGTQPFQDAALSDTYGAKRMAIHDEGYYISGNKLRDYNYAQKSKEKVRSNIPTKTSNAWTEKPKSKPAENVDLVTGPKEFPATDMSKASLLDNSSTLVGNASFIAGSVSTYRACRVLPDRPVSMYTFGTKIPAVSQNYRLGKCYSSTTIGRINALNTGSNVLTFYTMVSANYNLAYNTFDGNPNTNNTVRNYCDAGFGIMGGVGVLYISTPFGWVCATGSGLYGLGTLIYDLSQVKGKNSISNFTPSLDFNYFHQIDNTRTIIYLPLR